VINSVNWNLISNFIKSEAEQLKECSNR